uniref:Uncharacterized protein n=1 Tax=Romanomermis culicivorax TaxID=13658 RepID=A0A915I1V3_ROMCU
MERIDSVEVNNYNKQYRVNDFLALEIFPVQAISSDSLTQESLRLLVENIRRVAPKIRGLPDDLQFEYLKNGFVHGTLFARSEYGDFEPRVYYSYPVEQLHAHVRLTVEPKVFLKNFPKFPQPHSLSLIGNDSIKKPDADIIDQIVDIFKTNSQETVEQSITEYLNEQIRLLVTFDLKSQNPTYIKAYLLGLIFSSEMLHVDWHAYYSPDEKFAQIILRHPKTLLLVFNFDSQAEISIQGLKLQQFQHRTRQTHVLIISVLDILSACNYQLNRPIMQNVRVTQLKLMTKYGASSKEIYIKIPATNILPMLLEMNDVPENGVSQISQEFTHLFLSVREICKHNAVAFGDFLQGILHNIVKYAEQMHSGYEVQIDKFLIDSGTFCVRIRSNGCTAEINFMTFDLENSYQNERMVYFQAARQSEYRFLNLFYNYDIETGSTALRLYYTSKAYPQQIYAACHDATKKLISCTPVSLNDNTWLEINKSLPSLLREHLRLVTKLLGSHAQSTSSLLPRNKRGVMPSFEANLAETLYNGHHTDDEVEYHAYNYLRESMHQRLSINSDSFVADLLVWFARLQAWRMSKLFGDQDLAFDQLTYKHEVGRVDNIMKIGFFDKLRLGVNKFFAFNRPVEILTDLDSKLWNTETMNNIIDFLENEPDVESVFTSVGCFDRGFNVPCQKIVIDFRRLLLEHEYSISRINPDIPENYVHTCKATDENSGSWQEGDLEDRRIFKTIKLPNYIQNAWPSIIRPPQRSSPLVRACGNAFGITRKSATGNTIVYKLHGNLLVYAPLNASNFFILSGGDYFTIIGGGKQNVVKFKSFFTEGFIDFSDGIANIADFSSVVDSMNYTIIFNASSVEIEQANGFMFSHMYLINMNKLVVGREEVAENIIIDCSTAFDTIEVKNTPRCEEQSLHRVTIMKCAGGNLDILLNGCIKLRNENQERNFTYKIDSLTNDVRIRLIASKHVKHTIDMTLINITNLDKIKLTRHSETQYDLQFDHENGTLLVQIQDNLSTRESICQPLFILFQGGMTMSFWNGTLQTSIYFPKSKGQFWLEYDNMLQLFYKAGVLMHGLSERDRDYFTLLNGTIKRDGRRMLFSVSTNDMTYNFECNAGYNILLVNLPSCEMEMPTRLERGIETLVIHGSPFVDYLDIDLTPITDYLSEISLNYSSIKITPSMNKGVLNLSVTTSNLPWKQYHLGNIILLDILSDDWYKKVTIKEKIDFTLHPDKSGNIRLIPQIKISPLHSIVIFDENSVEEYEDLLFVDRPLINYNLIMIDNSTLVITNAAVDAMKTFVLSSYGQPLHTIIVKDLDKSKMRTLKLKFDYNIIIDLSNLDESKIFNLNGFRRKIEKIAAHLSRTTFLLRKDTRFGRAK